MQASVHLQPAQRSPGRLCRRAQGAKHRSENKSPHLQHLLPWSQTFTRSLHAHIFVSRKIYCNVSLYNLFYVIFFSFIGMLKWNINFFANADCRPDLSHDGNDCNSGTWLPAAAASQGETHLCNVTARANMSDIFVCYVLCSLYGERIWQACFFLIHKLNILLHSSLSWVPWSLSISRACWCSSEKSRTCGGMTNQNV